MNILIDTNIALHLLGGDPRIAEVLDGEVVHVSFATELKLPGYPLGNSDSPTDVRSALGLTSTHDSAGVPLFLVSPDYVCQ